jgi:hypothetical protein
VPSSHHQYDPNQPRVPKGHPTGGQWTDGNHGQRTLLEEGDRSEGDYDPDAIVQEGEGADGDDAQDTLVHEARLRLRAAPRPSTIPPAVRDLEKALSLYAALSTFNSRDKLAIIEFRAREYKRSEPGSLTLVEARLLSRSEVKAMCDKLDDVQGLTDKGAAKVERDNPGLSPTDYGTAVHTHVAHAINKPPDRRHIGPPLNPNFRAEMSALKIGEALTQKRIEYLRGDKGVPHGALGTVRIDVYENMGNGTVCIYDIKTGESALGPGRMRELAHSILTPERIAEIKEKIGVPVDRIIVTEVRPTFLRGFRPLR